MVKVESAYNKGRHILRRVSTAFTVFLGFLAILFSGVPKMWIPDSLAQSKNGVPGGFFTPFITGVAHADVPAADCSSPTDCSSGGGENTGGGK